MFLKCMREHLCFDGVILMFWNVFFEGAIYLEFIAAE